MSSKKLKGLVLAIYGVMLDVFALHNLIPVFIEDGSLSDEEKAFMILWIILWMLSFVLIAVGTNMIGNDNPTTNQTVPAQNINAAKPSSAVCPQCVNVNMNNAVYCTNCGHSLRNNYTTKQQ